MTSFLAAKPSARGSLWDAELRGTLVAFVVMVLAPLMAFW
jgi:hypothetical protein